jgi:gas vesicle protein
MERGDVSCFLLGLGVGIGIGLLFAPKSGEETRGMIKSKAGEGREYLKQRGAELRDSASDLIDKGRDAVNRQRDNLMEAMEAGKQAYRETVGEQPPKPGPQGA